MSKEALEQRLRDLCGFIVKQIASHKRRRITILVDGESFGIASVEELENPRGPIPGSTIKTRADGPGGEIVFCN